MTNMTVRSSVGRGESHYIESQIDETFDSRYIPNQLRDVIKRVSYLFDAPLRSGSTPDEIDSLERAITSKKKIFKQLL